jgi:hypothetical protein
MCVLIKILLISIASFRNPSEKQCVLITFPIQNEEAYNINGPDILIMREKRNKNFVNISIPLFEKKKT